MSDIEITPELLAIHWLVLDNLHHGWPEWAGMTRHDAQAASAWAKSKGFTLGGRITDDGRAFYLANYSRRFTDAS